jgi:hypothetical protein
MKVQNRKILIGTFAIMMQLSSFGQANNPPTGTSTNLCPMQTYRYTSPVANDDGRCDRFGWKVENGNIITDGLNSNGTVWADVQWDNVSSGTIGNFCGALVVSINSIAQPTMSGPSTVLLCGTSSITLQATVSSTANITGYVWDVKGTGVSPTGIITTTAPQLTLNYTNWTAGSSLSATVAVGTKNSCGFTTETSPLVAYNDGIISIPAIPRSAWVQLSPGNIDDLLVPLQFSPSIICENGTMQITNQPSGANVVWSSSNPSALAVDPLTGTATRLNGFNGAVSVSATVSNVCGSNTQSTSVWLGVPGADINTLLWAGTRGVNPVQTSPSTTYTFRCDPVSGATSYTWVLPSGFSALGGNTTTSSPSIYITTSAQSGTFTLYCNVNNACGSKYANSLRISNGSTGGGGGTGCPPGVRPPCKPGPGPLRIATSDDDSESTIGTIALSNPTVYPNPSNKNFTVSLVQEGNVAINGTLDAHVELTLYNVLKKVVYQVNTNESIIVIPVENLPSDVYYLSISYRDQRLQKKLIVIN